MITRNKAEEIASQLEEILTHNPNFLLIKHSYVGPIQATIASIRRRAAQGEFGPLVQAEEQS